MTVSDQLNALINDAHRNGKPEVFAALKLLRDPIAGLERELAAAQALLLSVERMMDNGTYGDTATLIGPIRDVLRPLPQPPATQPQL